MPGFARVKMMVWVRVPSGEGRGSSHPVGAMGGRFFQFQTVRLMRSPERIYLVLIRVGCILETERLRPFGLG